MAANECSQNLKSWRSSHFVQENPDFETTPFRSDFENDYGHFSSVADLFRQIGLDERHHKLESLNRIEQPRFS